MVACAGLCAFLYDEKIVKKKTEAKTCLDTNNRRKMPSLWFFLYPLIREQTKPTVKPDKEVNKKLGLNASPVEKDDITLKHHTIVIAHKADNNGAKI